jgi:hypothetical protein
MRPNTNPNTMRFLDLNVGTLVAHKSQQAIRIIITLIPVLTGCDRCPVTIDHVSKKGSTLTRLDVNGGLLSKAIPRAIVALIHRTYIYQTLLLNAGRKGRLVAFENRSQQHRGQEF